MGMTKGDQLKKLQAQANKIKKRKTFSGKVKTWAISGLLVIGTAIGVGTGASQTSVERQSAYDQYRQSPEAIASFENLGYEDTFDIWNNKDLGNDVNALLTGGQVYIRNHLRMFPSADGSALIITDASGNERTIDMPASYLNVVDDVLYFRNDADRSIYTYNLQTETLHSVSSGNMGEVFVANDLIYYIDYTTDFSVQAIPLSGGAKTEVISSPVASFAVCGDCIIYLDTNSDLYYSPFDADTPKKLVGNIERFLIGDRIYAESKNTIFSFTPTGSEAREEYSSGDDSLRLIGYLDGNLFFQEEGHLKYLSGGTSTTICSDAHSHYTSPVKDASGALYTVAYAQETNQEVLKLDPIPETGGVDSDE